MSLGTSGGPDAGGYIWVDGDTRTLASVEALVLELEPLDLVGDEAVVEVSLPRAVFPDGFPFYGAAYDRFWLSTNGWLAFEDPRGESHPNPVSLPGAEPPNGVVAFLWDDLVVESARAGEDGDGDGYTIELTMHQVGESMREMRVAITLDRIGGVTLAYRGDPVVSGQTVIGLEGRLGGQSGRGAARRRNPPAGQPVGLRYMTGGVAQNGAVLRDGSSIRFLPPTALDCDRAVTDLVCGGEPVRISGRDGALGTSTVERYRCGGEARFEGEEVVFRLNVPTLSVVDLSLEGRESADMGIFLLTSICHPGAVCLAGGERVVRALLAPGTYHVVVDARTAREPSGAIDLQVACDAVAAPLACGERVRGSVGAGGRSWVDAWGCAEALPGPGAPFDGPETFYLVQVPPGAHGLQVELWDESAAGLRTMVVDVASFTAGRSPCLDGGQTGSRLAEATAGTYLVAVDGPSGASGGYALRVACAGHEASAPDAERARKGAEEGVSGTPVPESSSVPESTTLWAASGSSIYNTNTGSVGIGTTVPTEKLEVRDGSVRLRQSLTGFGVPSTFLKFDRTFGDGTAANKIKLYTISNWVGGFGIDRNHVDYFSGANHRFWVHSTEAALGEEALLIREDGRIGIGLSTPREKVDIRNGSLALSQSPEGARIVSTYLAFSKSFGDGTTANKIKLFEAANWVGGFGISSGHVDYFSGDHHRFYINSDKSSLGTVAMIINPDGRVGIGTSSPQSTLSVDGTITSREVRVTATGWADHVFADDYPLMSLADVRRFIQSNGHLPGVPDAKTVAKEGRGLGETDVMLLQKVEELYLHVMELNERLVELELENSRLRMNPRPGPTGGDRE